MAETAGNFHLAATTEDPMSAERVVEALRLAQIEAFARPRGAASSAPFEPVDRASYEIFVPDQHRDQAERLIREELDAIEKEGEENARAAEEEELSTEPKG